MYKIIKIDFLISFIYFKNYKNFVDNVNLVEVFTRAHVSLYG